MPRHLRSLAALAAAALAVAVLPGSTSANAAPDGAMFRSLDGFRPSGPHVRVSPDHFEAFRVDTAQVRSALADAPAAGADGSAEIAIPTPTGGVEHFAVQRTSLMQPKLAAAHPEIQTWSGRSLDHRGTSVAMDLTPMGFHASVRPAGGQSSWYVDPAYNLRGTTTHLSYYGGSLGKQAQQMVEREMPDVQKAIARRGAAKAPVGGMVQQKVYRLALVTDPTYAAYFGAENVMAEKVTLMNRVNQIYNDDLAINMQLVNGEDKLNFATDAMATGPDGPCGANPCWVDDPDATANGGYVQGQIAYCDVGTLERNQIVLGQLIGASNYDIGHIMLGVNGGGIAGLGVVGSIEKGMGCTGLPDPTGDFMAIDYVAHEMGHEFGGNHTFNGNQWNCSGGNRESTTSVEPGSGSSVMAYAGICRQDNLQPHTDPYFSQRTLTEVNRYTGSPAADPVEVQDVAFRGLENGDTVTVGFPGAVGTKSFVVGTTTGASAYTAANMATQLSALVGKDVTVAGWGYDPYALIYTDEGTYPATLTEPNLGGFQVMFAGDPDPYTNDSDRTDEPDLQVTAPGASYVHVGETAKGGEPGNTGFQVNPIDNHDPVVTAPASRTIPTRTPFTLTGSATDADGDPLIYLWEQNDDARRHDGTALVANKKIFGPLFRVFGVYANVTDKATLEYESPGENLATDADRTRTFPDMAQILAGATNAKTGKCPKVKIVTDPYVPVPRRPLNCYSEFLPTASYKGTPGMTPHAMHFRLTARDRVPQGGGVGWDQVTIKVDPNAGPFLVSSFGEKGASVKGGKKVDVTWKVNGTRKLAKDVQIRLSTDDGQSWTTVLAKRTANDGKATVKLPKRNTRTAWIMVRSVDNYFFDVNDKVFSIK
ncbi:reprolysin-like metallopeptidase [Nocardioides sp. URHA0032]|uniref:reprolysin-like metallopeptidase n=1 Tax=Nocardioides sp. URHA0032 TaxID=1380388 RepID=UPI000565E0E7|nr:M12 family metallo-peptidase [Nocardioides sp. URHA0032]